MQNVDKVVKALQCCNTSSDHEDHCSSCPYEHDEWSCHHIERIAAELILEQQKAIDQLESRRSNNMDNLMKAIKETPKSQRTITQWFVIYMMSYGMMVLSIVLLVVALIMICAFLAPLGRTEPANSLVLIRSLFVLVAGVVSMFLGGDAAK